MLGKPVLMDKLDAALAARISLWIAKDTEKAQARKRARAEKKKARKRRG